MSRADQAVEFVVSAHREDPCVAALSAHPQLVPGVGEIGLRNAEDGTGEGDFVQLPQRGADPGIRYDGDGDNSWTHTTTLWQEWCGATSVLPLSAGFRR